MKKKVLINLLVIASVSLGALGLTTLSASASNVKRVSSSYIKKNGIKHRFYRLTKNTKAFIYYYVNEPGAVRDALTHRANIIMPKGTVIDSQFTGSKTSKKVLYGTGVDLSYTLKYKLLGKNRLVGGPTFAINYSSNTVRIKRPGYMLPYGNNVLYSGGLTGFSQFGTYDSNAVKLTSDGYVEYYKYANRRAAENIISAYQKQTIPTSYAKINRSVVKGNVTYLYYGHKLKGVSDSKVRTKGHYQYRLAIANQHTPYRLNNDASASVYTIGNQNFFTFVTGSKE
ncbi:hypothetical protein ABC628_01220 [Lentilactobacillus otakiensis]|uniref:Surface layer protein A domain-containing protein n=1 Tax=Lentilactobacillus otakiensis DSM 19908 = JCM 15040 TaxID=1423780 RepID=S4NPY5_9LACO|nr:hypothetical protein [Lentilactobacillus otakiensis]KRL10479.1 hypothetical protein FD05_GL000607 [Lentilactobacillus otakiensis DSM 19908 = JCM 15040]MBZ3776403.1 hypothetical protein [Lentilactobacillus otakiensis]MDV3518169.1 hypothetical protein [Lentilactobacillus otakiensis]GAD16093.1 hypothetical protein LOT_0631 [Lentilactobacillus otakiensis DSM 19908 = JCM 15040]